MLSSINFLLPWFSLTTYWVNQHGGTIFNPTRMLEKVFSYRSSCSSSNQETTCKSVCVWVHGCCWVCVWERESKADKDMNKWMCKRKRKKKSKRTWLKVCMSEKEKNNKSDWKIKERERESLCVCAYVSVKERVWVRALGREHLYVCVCVREREILNVWHRLRSKGVN